MELYMWCPAKRGANMTTVPTRGAKATIAVRRDASHTAFFVDRSVNRDVVLADLDILPADNHCRVAHARQYARQAAAATAAAAAPRVCTHTKTRVCQCLTLGFPAGYALEYIGDAAWNGLHARDAWHSCTHVP